MAYSRISTTDPTKSFVYRVLDNMDTLSRRDVDVTELLRLLSRFIPTAEGADEYLTIFTYNKASVLALRDAKGNVAFSDYTTNWQQFYHFLMTRYHSGDSHFAVQPHTERYLLSRSYALRTHQELGNKYVPPEMVRACIILHHMGLDVIDAIGPKPNYLSHDFLKYDRAKIYLGYVPDRFRNNFSRIVDVLKHIEGASVESAENGIHLVFPEPPREELISQDHMQAVMAEFESLLMQSYAGSVS